MKRIISLDIGHDAVKAVSVRVKGGNVQLLDFWYEPLEAHSEKNRSQALVEALKKIAKQFPKSGYSLVTALSREETMLQSLSFPFSDLQKVYKVARYEVEPYLPFPLDKVFLDFYVLDSQNNSAEIMVVGAPKDVVEERLLLLKAANLQPAVITLDAMCLAFAFSQLQPLPQLKESALLLDIGLQKSTLNVVREGKLRFSRSLEFSREMIAPAEESVGSQEVADLSRKKALQESFSQLLREINLCLQSWGLKRQGAEPVKLFVTGGGSNTPGLTEVLAAELSLPTENLNLLASLMTPQLKEKLSGEMSLMNLALALVWPEIKGSETNSINFLKERQLAKGGRSTMQKVLIGAGIIGGLIVFLGGGDLYLKTNLAEKQVKKVNAQIISQFKRVSPQTKRIVNPYQQLSAQLTKMEKKNRLLKKLLGRRSSGLGVLRDLSEIIPVNVNVQLSGFLVDKDNIQINGETPSFEQVERLMKVIEESPKFSQVKVLESGSPREGNNVKFKIRMKVIESE